VRLIAAALFALLAGAVVTVASPPTQDPPPQTPIFRTGVDLLTVQATVVDSQNRPVTDLEAGDFSVTVGGKPRKVLFARFYGTEQRLAAGSAGTATPAATSGAGVPASNLATAGGRVVVFVIDRDSIRSGNEKPAFETASKVLDSLTPADAVGLIGVPTGAVELSRDHARVRGALLKMTGTEPRLVNGQDRYLTWDEAIAFDRGDRQTMGMVVERECQRVARSEMAPPDRCPSMLADQAREMLQVGRGHVRTTLSVLRSLAQRLETVRGPKHIIFISGGKAFDMDLAGDYKDFARDAAAAQIVLYAVHLDVGPGDVSDRRVTGSAFGGRDMASGLTTMAGMTGGAYLSAVARATGVFDRIRTEIGNFYELGVETTPADVDGKPHDIDVKLERPGLSIRARQQIVVPASVSKPSGDPLLRLFEQPVDLAEIPLTLAAYTTRGEDPATLRVLLSAEIGASGERQPAEWGFLVFDKDDKLVADGRQTLDSTAPWTVTSSAQLAPGRYRLKLAAIDADRRAGAIEVPLTVGLRAAGPLQVSDLIVGVTPTGRLQPRSHVVRGAPLSALMEVLSGDPEQLAKSRVALEVIPAGAPEPVTRVLMAARSSGSDVVLLNEARLDTTQIPPGRYTVSAVVLLDAQPVGRVSRVIEIVSGR
jgi:VWFA-related protein